VMPRRLPWPHRGRRGRTKSRPFQSSTAGRTSAYPARTPGCCKMADGQDGGSAARPQHRGDQDGDQQPAGKADSGVGKARQAPRSPPRPRPRRRTGAPRGRCRATCRSRTGDQPAAIEVARLTMMTAKARSRPESDRFYPSGRVAGKGRNQLGAHLKENSSTACGVQKDRDPAPRCRRNTRGGKRRRFWKKKRELPEAGAPKRKKTLHVRTGGRGSRKA